MTMSTKAGNMVVTERGQTHSHGLRGRGRELLDRVASDRGKMLGRAVARGAVSSDRRLAERAGRRLGSDRLARAGQRVDVVGAVLSLIIVAVIAYVGLDVIGEVDDSTDVSGSTELQNASTDLDSGIESAFGLMGVVFLVLLLSVIIGLFLGLRR